MASCNTDQNEKISVKTGGKQHIIKCIQHDSTQTKFKTTQALESVPSRSALVNDRPTNKAKNENWAGQVVISTGLSDSSGTSAQVTPGCPVNLWPVVWVEEHPPPSGAPRGQRRALGYWLQKRTNFVGPRSFT